MKQSGIPLILIAQIVLISLCSCGTRHVVASSQQETAIPLHGKVAEIVEKARGKHVGKALYEYVRDYAQSIGCNNITLNVWDGNDAALSFYKNMGMKVQKTTMEIVL